ncbi:MAG: 50S ribosome-binding GTPase, partial [Prevotella sp.]|nr:50S ribosome-binding GTPase [Prevotella sp.]
MRLSDLHTGQSGIIVKVLGHGGFRKRVVEMGFIKGKKVDVLLNAPLRDPVKYKIMGYEVSLRHSEAEMIEVITEEEAHNINEKNKINNNNEALSGIEDTDNELTTAGNLEQLAEKKSKTINVALVGNPNCGKTSLFNFVSGAHEHVGNYSGVTVDAKEGHASFNGYEFNIVDLPGTYSLSAYSPEELYVRKQLVEQTPDVIINVIDTSNLERNLYLTTQLIDMHLRMVVALNMFDETEKRGDNIDYDKLSELFGVPMVPTVFTTGKGVENLFKQIIKTYEGTEDTDAHYRHIHINHGHELEHGIREIQEHLKQVPNLTNRYSTRYLAIKLLEHDEEVENLVNSLPDAHEIMLHRDDTAERVKEEINEDSETAIMDSK